MEIVLPDLRGIENDGRYKVLGVHLGIPFDLDDFGGLTLEDIRGMEREDFIKKLSEGYVSALHRSGEYLRHPDENLKTWIFVAPKKPCLRLDELNETARDIQEILGEGFKFEEARGEPGPIIITERCFYLYVPRLTYSQPLVSFDLPFPLNKRIDSSSIIEACIYPAIPPARKKSSDGFYTRISYDSEKDDLSEVSSANFFDPVRADITLYTGEGDLSKVFS